MLSWGTAPTRSAGALQAQGAVASTASYQANVQVKHVISPKLYVYCILITTTQRLSPLRGGALATCPHPLYATSAEAPVAVFLAPKRLPDKSIPAYFTWITTKSRFLSYRGANDHGPAHPL